MTRQAIQLGWFPRFKITQTSAEGNELLNAARLAKVDFVIGGPPCQPFSIVGKRLGGIDHRADMINHFARLVGELEPRAFLLENVPNLASMEGGSILDRLVRRMRRLGFGVRAEVVAAADYGVPQVRKRLIVVGIRRREGIKFPDPTHGPLRLPYRTAKDAIGDLPDAGEFGVTGIYNHEPTEHSGLCNGRRVLFIRTTDLVQRLQVARRELDEWGHSLRGNSKSHGGKTADLVVFAPT
jgi:DNA-cytosine methyltransferase